MKRRVVIVLIFLLLGAIVNLAVAWGGAVWSTPSPSLIDDGGPDGTSLLIHASSWSIDECMTSKLREYGFSTQKTRRPTRMWKFTNGQWQLNQGPAKLSELRLRSHDGMARAMRYGPTTAPIDWTDQTVPLCSVLVSAGWPWRCCTGEIQIGASPSALGLAQRCVDAIPVPGGRWGVPYGRALPLRAAIPEIGINTVVYGLMLWLLFAAPFALRRRLRLKRGLCPACAYPIGTSPVCTECGGPVGVQR